jgi:hypothetical protein
MSKNARLFLFRFTLIAFLFSAVVPFFAVYELPQSHSEQEELASLFGDQILICTEKGFEWISLADAQGGKLPHKRDSHLKCAMCFVTAKGGSHHQLSPLVLALDVPLGKELRQHFAPSAAVVDSIQQRPAAPRGPPAIV